MSCVMEKLEMLCVRKCPVPLTVEGLDCAGAVSVVVARVDGLDAREDLDKVLPYQTVL